MEYVSRDAVDYAVEGHSLHDIVNFNEVLVLEAMRRLYRATPALCRCTSCLEDVYALAINALPPRYIQATSVRQYRESPAYVPPVDAVARVREAAERVRQSPRH